MTSDSIVLQVDGLALQRDPTDGAFRIRDIELAERLGYDRPRNIRKLIVAMIERGDLPGLAPRSTVQRIEKNRGFVQGVEDRAVDEYWLDRIEHFCNCPSPLPELATYRA